MKQFIVNDKYLDAMSIGLKDATYLFVSEGTIRSQKTVTATQLFFECVQDSDQELHLLSAENLDSIRDNILKSEFGLEVCYSKYVRRVKEEFGGYYLEVKCDIPDKPKIKRVLLCGYSTANQWEKINGKTLGVIYVDEVNNANEQFIDECFARQASVTSPKMIWTLNGDVPSHFIYQKYINRCKIIGDAPASIRADMDKVQKEKGWYYMHWTMKDNPVMTNDKIERASSIYPIGSYYHTIKIKGERGAPGRLIYINYLDSNKLIKKVDLKEYHHFVIGGDIGANKAMNSFTITGFNKHLTKAAFVDKTTFQQVGYEQKTELLIAFVKLWQSRGCYIKCIAIDNAEANYIRDLQAKFKAMGLPEVVGSYKYTIKERIDMDIILFASARLIFNDTVEGRDLYDAFRICKWVDGKEGIEREDNNEPHNDKIDSGEYSLTVHMKDMMYAVKRLIDVEEVA